MMKWNYLFGIPLIYGTVKILVEVFWNFKVTGGLVFKTNHFLDIKTWGFENEVTWSFLCRLCRRKSQQSWNVMFFHPWESAPKKTLPKEVEDHRRHKLNQVGNMVTPGVWLDAESVTLNPLIVIYRIALTFYVHLFVPKCRLQSMG